MANKLAQRLSVRPNQQRRRAVRVGAPAVRGRMNFNRGNNKIAMQAARKNVQKAKRLLTTRRAPVQQIMV